MSGREAFTAGARAVAPLLIGVVPFGLIAGVTAVDAGMSPLQAIAMSVVVFAGAAQLAAIDLVGQSAPVAVIVLTALIINLRFMMYSASISPYFRRFDTLSRWLGAYLITDQAYAISILEFRRTGSDSQRRKWFYFGSALPFWATWQLSTVAGAILGTSVPDGLSLEFAVPLMFIALLFPAVDDRPTEFTAIVSGGVSVVAAVLPFNLGLVTSALVGIAAGVAVERRRGSFPTTDTVSDHGFDSREGSDGA